MVISTAFLLIFLAIILGFVLTNIAVKRFGSIGILDLPEERSLHSRPTPTAGGFIFILTYCLLTSFGHFADILTLNWLIFILGMSLLGGLDDLAPQKVRVRIVGQLILMFICWWSIIGQSWSSSYSFFDNYLGF